jgi:hypothetical protein
MDMIMSSGVLRERTNSNFMDQAVFGGGSNGPCSLTDTTLTLLTNVMSSTLCEGPRKFELFALKALGWLTLHWTLRTLHLLLTITVLTE